MKRIRNILVATLLILAMIFAFASCGTDGTGDGDGDTVEPEVDEQGNTVVRVMVHVDAKSAEGIAYQ